MSAAQLIQCKVYQLILHPIIASFFFKKKKFPKYSPKLLIFFLPVTEEEASIWEILRKAEEDKGKQLLDLKVS